MKEARDVLRVATEAGLPISGDSRIILSCGSGVSAAVVYLALIHAGVNDRRLALYDGSWSEYASHLENEVLSN